MDTLYGELIPAVLTDDVRDPTHVSALYKLMRRAGADADSLSEAFATAGLTHWDDAGFGLSDNTSMAQPGGRNAGNEIPDHLLVSAIRYGASLASVDDDYTKGEYTDDATLNAQILPPESQALYDLLCALWMNLGDMRRNTQDRVELEALDDVEAAIHERLAELDAKRVSVDVTEEDWNHPEERRKYYFKLGILKSLQSSGALKGSDLGPGFLRRTRGYHIDRAFQRLVDHAPALASLVLQEPAKVKALSDADLESVIGGQAVLEETGASGSLVDKVMQAGKRTDS